MLVAYEDDGVRFSEDASCLEVNFGTKLEPADYCFLFKDEKWEYYDEEVEDVKEDTANAYNKVGETANRKGNLKKAEKVMKALDYSHEEFEIAGQDAYNF